MTRPGATVLSILISVLVAGCGGGDDRAASDRVRPGSDAGTRLQATAATPAAAAALSAIPDGRWSQRQVGYVNLDRIRALDALPAAEVLDRVLGRGANALRALPAGSARTAVRLGTGVTVLRGDGVARAGRSIGPGAVAAGADADLATRLAAPSDVTAITPAAQSAVQSCIGDTVAQTVLGPGVMGADAAVGVGIAASRDAPAGLQLRICGAPHYRRHIHAMERRLQRRFGRSGAGARSAPVIGEHEIGEREVVRAVVAAESVPRAVLLRLLAGGRSLRALAWR